MGKNYSTMDVTGMNFNDKDLSFSNFSQCENLKDANWSNTILIGCNFDETDLDGMDFSGKDLTACSFNNCVNLDKADFTGATNINTCDFKDTEWQDKVDFSDVVSPVNEINEADTVLNEEENTVENNESIDDTITDQVITENTSDNFDMAYYDEEDIPTITKVDAGETDMSFFDADSAIDETDFIPETTLDEKQFEQEDLSIGNNDEEILDNSDKTDSTRNSSADEKTDNSSDIITKDKEQELPSREDITSKAYNPQIAKTYNLGNISDIITNKEDDLKETINEPNVNIDDVISGISRELIEHEETLNNIDPDASNPDIGNLMVVHGQLEGMKNVLNDSSSFKDVDDNKIKEFLVKIDALEQKCEALEDKFGVFKQEEKVEVVSNTDTTYEKLNLAVEGFDNKLNFNRLCNMVGITEQSDSIHRFGVTNGYAKNGHTDRSWEIKLIPAMEQGVISPYAVGRHDIGGGKELLFIGSIASDDKGPAARIENIHFIGTDGTNKNIPNYMRDDAGRCTSFDLNRGEFKQYVARDTGSGVKNLDGKIDTNATFNNVVDTIIKNSCLQEVKIFENESMRIDNTDLYTFKNELTNLVSNADIVVKTLEVSLDKGLQADPSDDLLIKSDTFIKFSNDKEQLSNMLTKVDKLIEKAEGLNNITERAFKCENNDEFCNEASLYISEATEIRNEFANLYSKYSDYVEGYKADNGYGVSKEQYAKEILKTGIDMYNSSLNCAGDTDKYDAYSLHIGEKGFVYDGLGIDATSRVPRDDEAHRNPNRTCSDNNRIFGDLVNVKFYPEFEDVGKIILDGYKPMTNDDEKQLLNSAKLIVDNTALTSNYIKYLMDNGMSRDDASNEVESLRSKHFGVGTGESLSSQDIANRIKGYARDIEQRMEVGKKEPDDVAKNDIVKDSDLKSKAKKFYDSVSNKIEIQSKMLGRLAYGDILIIGMTAAQAISGLIAGEEKYHFKDANGIERIGYYSTADAINSIYHVMTSSPTAMCNSLLYRALNFVCTRTIDIAIRNLIDDRVEANHIEKNEDKPEDATKDSGDFIEEGVYDSKSDVIEEVKDENSTGIVNDEGQDIEDGDKISSDKDNDDNIDNSDEADTDKDEIERSSEDTPQTDVEFEDDNIENKEEDVTIGDEYVDNYDNITRNDEEVKDEADNISIGEHDVDSENEHEQIEKTDDKNNDSIENNEHSEATENDISSDNTDVSENMINEESNNTLNDSIDNNMLQNEEQADKLSEEDKITLKDNINEVLEGTKIMDEVGFTQYLDKDSAGSMDVINESLSEKIRECLSEGANIEDAVEKVAGFALDITNNYKAADSLENILGNISKKIKNDNISEKIYEAAAQMSKDTTMVSVDDNTDVYVNKEDDKPTDFSCEVAGNKVDSFSNGPKQTTMVDNEVVTAENADLAIAATEKEVEGQIEPIVTACVENEPVDSYIDRLFSDDSIISKDDIVKVLENIRDNLPTVIQIASDPEEFIKSYISSQIRNLANDFIADVTGVDVKGTIDEFKQELKDNLINSIKDIISDAGLNVDNNYAIDNPSDMENGYLDSTKNVESGMQDVSVTDSPIDTGIGGDVIGSGSESMIEEAVDKAIEALLV